MTNAPAATAEPDAATVAIGYDQAVTEFLDYLAHYRNYSPLTVRGYATDLRMFREFLESRLGRIPPRPRSNENRSSSSASAGKGRPRSPCGASTLACHPSTGSSRTWDTSRATPRVDCRCHGYLRRCRCS